MKLLMRDRWGNQTRDAGDEHRENRAEANSEGGRVPGEGRALWGREPACLPGVFKISHDG